MVTAQSQALILLAGQALLRAGAETGIIDPSEYRSRLAPALEDAQSSWAGLAGTWRALTPPGARRLDPALRNAANEARAALLGIVHDRAALATPTVLAARVDLADTAHTIQDGLSAAVDQAHLVQEVTREHGLTGSARAVNTMTIDLASGRPGGGLGGSGKAWVNPRDLLSNRLVPLPTPVREAMSDAAAQTLRASGRAMNAAALLDHPRARVDHPNQPTPTVGASRVTAAPPRLAATRQQTRGPQP